MTEIDQSHDCSFCTRCRFQKSTEKVEFYKWFQSFCSISLQILLSIDLLPAQKASVTSLSKPLRNGRALSSLAILNVYLQAILVRETRAQIWPNLAPEYICRFMIDSLSPDSSLFKSAGCQTVNFGHLILFAIENKKQKNCF